VPVVPPRNAVSQAAVTILMSGASLVSLGLLVPAIRRARAAGDLDASAMLTLGTAWLVCLPMALVAFTGGVVRRPDAFRELVAVFPGWYPVATDLARLLVAALAGALLFRRVSSGSAPVHAAGLLAICLWGVAQLSTGLHGDPYLTLGGGALLVCLLAATVLPRGRGACLGAGIFAVTLAIAGGVLALLRHDVAFVVPCEGACGGLGFTGVLPNENLLGIALAAGIPFAYLGFRGSARWWFILYLAGMAIATGSRTAIIASIITAAALLVVRPAVDAGRQIGVRGAIAGVVLAAAVLASVQVVSGDWSGVDLTDRAMLWSVAADHIQQSPWFGHGPHEWEALYESSEIPRAGQRSTHNQWLDILFVAGGVGAALFVAMLAATLWSAGRARPGVMLALATIVMIGATEGGWSVGALDVLSFSLIGLLLIGQVGPAGARERRAALMLPAVAPLAAARSVLAASPTDNPRSLS
jgi:O-antigen ligase